jgi:predicted thioesterase/predicted enzyme related to lactoylglutathione lyase
MHRSRLAGFIIDCRTDDLEGAVDFWSRALGLPRKAQQDANQPNYVTLDADSRDLYMEVQKVDHDSRVHLDIESTDIEAEVARLERLGARRVANIRTWVVMEAPTGQRFCVVRGNRERVAAVGNRWDGEDRANQAPPAIDVPPGTVGTATLTVAAEHLASRIKDVMLPPVLATPVMIMVMENAALNALRPYFKPGETAVGTHVDVRHLAATPPGRTVTAKATVTGTAGRRVSFTVEAHDGERLIGTGAHERSLVELERIAKG